MTGEYRISNMVRLLLRLEVIDKDTSKYVTYEYHIFNVIKRIKSIKGTDKWV